MAFAYECHRQKASKCEIVGRAHLPFTVDTAGFGLIKSRLGVVRIEAYNESRDTERADTSRLRVFLHDR